MFIVAPALVALALIPVVSVRGWGTGILHALNESGLYQFANATASLDGTSGQYILTELDQGNKVIFAPTDNAYYGVDAAIIDNETSLADLISYHIISSNFINQTQTYPNVTIGRTLLNASNLVMLEGNKSQVLVWSRTDNGTLFVMNQGSNITVVNTTYYNDSAILAIDSVLTPPPNISTVLSNESYGLTAVAAFLNSTSVVNGPSLLEALNSAHGITVFAPNNAGVQAAQSSLSNIANNTTAVLNVFSNHIINGTSVYSTEISNGTSLVSEGGQDYAFLVNSTGNFVSVGGSNQVQIVEPNVLTSNGVIHIVNGVMLDTNSNAAAASSAFASATSVADHTTQSGPITAAATASAATTATSAATVTSAATPTSTPPQTQGAAVRGKVNNWQLGVLAGMVVGFGQLV